MQVVLLEDAKNARFGPLTLLRPEFEPPAEAVPPTIDS